MCTSLARFLCLLLLAVPSNWACRTTVKAQPFAVRDRAVVRHLLPERAFELEEHGQVLGRVVLFRSTDGEGESFWSVRDPWHHELGLLDELGRAWRYLPHGEEPEWIGSGGVLQGARLVLRAGEDARLREVQLDELDTAVASPPSDPGAAG